MAIVCDSFPLISGFYSKSLEEAQLHDKEATAIVNKLKMIIEERDKSTSNNIRIVSMLDKSKSYRMDGVLRRLLTNEIDSIPWTIHQDSQIAQPAIIKMMKYDTIFIFFAETVSTQNELELDHFQ